MKRNGLCWVPLDKEPLSVFVVSTVSRNPGYTRYVGDAIYGEIRVVQGSKIVNFWAEADKEQVTNIPCYEDQKPVYKYPFPKF